MARHLRLFREGIREPRRLLPHERRGIHGPTDFPLRREILLEISVR